VDENEETQGIVRANRLMAAVEIRLAAGYPKGGRRRVRHARPTEIVTGSRAAGRSDARTAG
jgi:hypothetical protein